MVNLSGIYPILPEIFAAISAVFILIFFSVKRYKSEVIISLSALLMLAVIISTIWAIPKDPVTIGRLFVVDSFSEFFRIMFGAAIVLTFLLSYRARELSKDVLVEYSSLLFLFYVAASFMVMSENLIALYLSMEILSLISYIGVSFNLDSLKSREAGLKYAIFGAVASSLMLFGISYIYGICGGLDYPTISKALSGFRDIDEPTYIMLLLVTLMIMGGMFFKLAAFPFYAWSPDAYQGGPTTFVSLLSTASKAAGVGALVRIIMRLFTDQIIGGSDLSDTAVILGTVSFFTMTLGNLMAINQNSIKRLLAYSSIAHAGYILMGLSGINEIGIRASQFYLIAYFVMNLGAFYCVQIIVDKVGDDSIERFSGMSKRSPFLAGIFTIFLLSLVGIPPFFGFVGKFYLFSAIISKGGAFYILLAIAGVINSAISLYYYARIIKAMYLTKDIEEVEDLDFGVMRKTVIGSLGAATLIFGIFFSPILRFVEIFSNIFK